MHFNRRLSYLGAQENVLKDGTKFYKVSMFDVEAAQSVTLNVMGDRADVMAELRSCQFGAQLDCNFALLPKDNLYRLSLVSCSKVGK